MILSYVQEEAERAEACARELETLREERDVLADKVFFYSLVTGPRRSLILKLSDTRVHEPHIRARLVTTADKDPFTFSRNAGFLDLSVSNRRFLSSFLSRSGKPGFLDMSASSVLPFW